MPRKTHEMSRFPPTRREITTPDTRFSVEMELAGTDENLLTECDVVWISENISIHFKAHKGMGVKPSGFRCIEKKGT